MFLDKLIKCMRYKITSYYCIRAITLLNYIHNFVQIGCHDGVMHDPLKPFILKNRWKGILVEPQKDMLKKCKCTYQNIQNLIYVNTAVYSRYEKINLLVAINPTDYSHT